MTFVEIPAPEFDLAMTLSSGQVFHWEKIAAGFCGTIGDEAVYLEQRGEILQIATQAGAPATPGSPELAPPSADLVKHYFALDHPLVEICASFPNDPVMEAARSFCRGLRIIRQPKWECLATFICSSMKQVAHIRQISFALRQRFGQPCKANGCIVYTFPRRERIACSSEKELRKCALGYRAKNLLATAQLVSSPEVDLESWASLSDEDLRAKLCTLPGVGLKVANCVMLFAYERLGAFPIDVWIARALKDHYFPLKRNIAAGELRRFAETYFGEYGGYAQQYLFHHMRAGRRKSGMARDSFTPLCSARNDRERVRAGSRKLRSRRDTSRLRSPPRSTPRQATALRSAQNDRKEKSACTRRRAGEEIESRTGRCL